MQLHLSKFLYKVIVAEQTIQGRSPGTVQTLNRILAVVGLKLGVVRAR